MRDKGEVLLTIFILALIPLTIFLYVTKYADAHTAKVHVKVQLSQDQCPGSEPDSGVLGCYFEGPRGVFNVFWTDHDPLTLSHELAHVYDATSLTHPYRVEFMRLFGLKGSWEDWFPTFDGLASASEWWAEAFARCARHQREVPEPIYGYLPNPAQHRAACNLIWRADKERNG